MFSFKLLRLVRFYFYICYLLIELFNFNNRLDYRLNLQ